MSRITTHVLDTARGEPARGLAVTLQRLDTDGLAVTIGAQTTDDDGRARGLLPDAVPIEVGRYRLLFEAGAYQRSHGVIAFFPLITVEFEVTDGERHHHVPLLLSPYGYSTYRGS
jgi:5-hydroxyisourate hydrolase